MVPIYVRQRDGRVVGGRREQWIVGAMRNLAPLFRPLGFRGYSRACRIIADSFLPGAGVQVALNSNTEFAFPLNDTYWIRLITSCFRYEPEVASLLMLIRSQPFTFIDCGANFGYWSCIVSSNAYGSHNVVAVEPSSTTFASLKANALLNGGRVRVEQAAISSGSGQAVRIGGGSHAARSILSAEGELVTTITIDDLLRKHQVAGPLVIKLDVEGVEIPALEGASVALSSNPLLLYEDHGNDPSSMVSAYLLERGWQLFSIARGRPEPVAGLADINAMKTNPRCGYNFVALKKSGWF